MSTIIFSFLPMFHDKVLLRVDETMVNYVYHPNYLQEMINYPFFRRTNEQVLQLNNCS